MIVQVYEIQTPEEAAMLDGGYCRSAAGGRRSKTKTDRGDGNGKDLDKVRRFVTAAKLTMSKQ